MTPLEKIVQPPPAPPTLKPTQPSAAKPVEITGGALAKPLSGNILGSR